MPDGVTVQGPDGQTYQFPQGTDKNAAIAYFKKKGIGAPGIIDRASQVTLGETLPDLWKGTKAYAQHPENIGKDVVKGAEGLVTGVASSVAHPFEAASNLTGAPLLEQDIKNKNYRGAAGDVLGGGANVAMILSGMKPTAEGIASTLQSLPNVPRAGIREFLGISDDDLKGLETRHNAEQAKAAQSYQDDLAAAKEKHAGNVQKIEEANTKAKAAYDAKVSDIKKSYSEEVAGYRKAAKEASAKESAAAVKRETLTKKSGPVYQRLTEQADNAQKMVQDTNAKVKSSFNGRYSAWRQKLPKDSAIDGELTQTAVQTAEKDILKGSAENISVFRNIMKESTGSSGLADASVFRGSRGVDVKEFLSSIKDPVKRNQFIKEMQAGGEDVGVEGPRSGARIPLDDAMGYSSELGEKLYQKGELPGDVYRALKFVRDHIDEQVMGVAKAANTGSEYKTLRSDYAAYKDAFYDHDSPLYKLRYAQDPGDKLRPIVGDEGARAIKLIGQFKEHGAKPGDLGRIRSLYSQVKDLPSSGGKMPTAPERPTIPGAPEAQQPPSFTAPEAPVSSPFDPVKAREQKLQSDAEGYARPPRTLWQAIPPNSAYKMTMKKLLQRQWFRDWISGAGEGGVVPSGSPPNSP